MIAKELNATGQNVRKYYQRRLPSNPSKDYYYILRDTPDNESLIVEYGFADNLQDANLIKNNYEELAEAVVKALADYTNVEYVPPVGSNMYKVVPGDTLWKIAKQFGITVEELKSANNLSSNALSIGQILRIPGMEDQSSKNYYIVQAGDSLYSIARKFNTTVDNLKRWNNLTSNLLQIGQRLLINDSQAFNPDTDETIYIVQAGDSLYSIARKFNTTVDALKSLNNLTSNLLQIGQKLRITESPSELIYIVKPGDNLYQIARNYGTTVSLIVERNNLANTNLSIGQRLIIPK